jgi:hypothetical protein
MSPPTPPGGQPPGEGIAVASQGIFPRFVDVTETNRQAFAGSTNEARTVPSPAAGRLSGSPGLMQQLTQAAQLRTEYIDATTAGLEGYKGATAAIGSRHAQLGSVTTAIMQRIMTVQSSKDGSI